MTLKTPIIFLVFNRPEQTSRVLAEIAKARPARLMVVADGPRPDRPSDREQCAAVRKLIDGISWPCEVSRHYADENLGCRLRVSSGLTWAFEQVEEAIILEDDCLPHPDFFPFCEELLDRYRNDERISMISGCNFQFGRRPSAESYYFSRYPFIWGWASWRRAWKYYDVNLPLWPEFRKQRYLKDILGTPGAVWYWTRIFNRCHRGLINTWDYQWTFALWLQGGFSIVSNVNLISNIGFTNEATHMASRNRLSDLPVEAVGFPLRHPAIIRADPAADRFVQRNIFCINWRARFRQLISLLTRRIPYR